MELTKEKKFGNDLLFELCSLFGPSGCERRVADYIAAQIADDCDELRRDRMGNLVVTVFGKKAEDGRPNVRLMLSAHMDEVGFMVKTVEDDGTMRVETLGGIDPSVLPAKRVTVEAKDGTFLPGVISSPAVHHKKKDARLRLPDEDELRIDAGLPGETLRSLVEPGAFATFRSPLVRFGENGDRVCGKAIDDRLGCALLIELAREAKKFPPTGTDLFFCFTVREELGVSGAANVAKALSPDAAVILETTAVGDLPTAEKRDRVAEVGKGGVVSLMDRSTVYPSALTDFALSLAKAHRIPAQVKQYVSGGNDAGSVHKTNAGVPCLAFSAPTRYLHSPSCLASLSDYCSMLALLRILISEDWRKLCLPR